jgi:hypothetical protein
MTNDRKKSFFLGSEEQREAVLAKLALNNGISKENLFRFIGGAFGETVRGK